MQVRIIKYVIMALAVITGIVWYVAVSPGENKNEHSIMMEASSYETPKSVEDCSEDASAALDDAMEKTKDEPAGVGSIFVYVCGAVLNPGVYELPGNVRVVAAIEAAGGFSEDAAQDYLNLARVAADGEKLVVPTVEEAEVMSLAGTSAGASENTAQESSSDNTRLSININTATKEELMELPGIGESRALSIIAYREENGAFGSIEEIMLVSGIKEGAFAKIKAYIRVTS